MTDREMLERAAKAAGIIGEWDDVYRALVVRRYYTGIVAEVWNPLTDDGDALRLAVALRVNIEHEVRPETVWANDAGETYEDDPNTATRRAITRAAASMAPKEPA